MALEKRLMKGNEAIGEAAIRAGCDAYFGYPITPQSELIAYMAKHMLDAKRVFIQAESEVSAINMVYGAGATGARAMTSSSSPGVSLKQEGISYACGADVPMVVVNVARSGPGLGGISPAQGDYFQSTRGGGHGDYYHIVLAPKSVQEAADLTYEAFDLADEWRMPAMILADGMIGQMMEGVSFPEPKDPATRVAKPWAVGNRNGRKDVNHVDSTHLVPEEFEQALHARYARYEEMKKVLPRFEEHFVEDADLILTAYGTSARVCLGAMQMARKLGLKVGLFRPITLWPYPEKRLGELEGKRFLAVEMSMGQMVEDVRLYTHGKSEVSFYGRCGGMIPTEEDVLAEIRKILKK
ncbi:MAG: 3-methyl-2-oxobutanoate dehydrogenase subunit VorB [Spirochaetae bacterium HGW-Spirochaetae-3]|jgi:2-oxoglutarate ferredoxin oxidoreductase subunit alpha|nr:MAG: 3-methyl-2-oxobutanoate dehydrogenase subunit VorB [Spirochaetae bacterium HGW-Spirochaetae-3]